MLNEDNSDLLLFQCCQDSFETFHYFLDFNDLSADLGQLGRFSLVWAFNGEPLKFMAAQQTKGKMNIIFLWSIRLYLAQEYFWWWIRISCRRVGISLICFFIENDLLVPCVCCFISSSASSKMIVSTSSMGELHAHWFWAPSVETDKLWWHENNN